MSLDIEKIQHKKRFRLGFLVLTKIGTKNQRHVFSLESCSTFVKELIEIPMEKSNVEWLRSMNFRYRDKEKIKIALFGSLGLSRFWSAREDQNFLKWWLFWEVKHFVAILTEMIEVIEKNKFEKQDEPFWRTLLQKSQINIILMQGSKSKTFLSNLPLRLWTVQSTHWLRKSNQYLLRSMSLKKEIYMQNEN